MKGEGNRDMKRIKQVSVKNLFGLFDHVIPLNLNEHITIIHGPNGVGKTAILRLLKSLFNGNNLALQKIPFDEFRLDFEDNTSFWVTKEYEETSQEETSTNYTITFHTDDKPAFTLLSKPTVTHRQLSFYEGLTSTLDHVGLETWRQSDIGEILSPDEALERLGERLPPEIVPEKEPDWLIEIKKNVPVRLIETQRLLNARKPSRRSGLKYNRQLRMIPTVTTYSEELAEIITMKLAESSARSQSLDRTFPRRVVDPNIKKRKITERELRDKLAALEQKRLDLMEAGLLDQSSDPVQVEQIDPSTNIVLSVYIEDTEQKLGIFDELANKIELLKRVINKRLL